MAIHKTTSSLSASDSYSDSVGMHNYFNISISGTWSGTLTVQRSFDYGTNWFDVDSFTANTEEYGYEPEPGVVYRIGFKSGDYNSGTANVRISQ